MGVDFLCASLTLLAQAEGNKRIVKELLVWLLQEGEGKLNRELTVVLVQHRLLFLNNPEYVSAMVKAMDMGRNTAAVDAVVWVLQQCLIEKRCVQTGDCASLLDALAKIVQSVRRAPDHLLKLLDWARQMARGGQPAVGSKAGFARYVCQESRACAWCRVS